VRNWPTLLRLIDEEGFPPGAMLGRNTRAWARWGWSSCALRTQTPHHRSGSGTAPQRN
jgi:hypothetical protein